MGATTELNMGNSLDETLFVDSYALTAWYDYSSSVRRKDLSPHNIHQDCSTALVSLQLLERSELSAHEAHLKLCVHVLHKGEMI